MPLNSNYGKPFSNRCKHGYDPTVCVHCERERAIKQVADLQMEVDIWKGRYRARVEGFPEAPKPDYDAMALVLSHEGHIEKMSREISRLNRELNTWKDRAEKALTTKMEAWKTNDIVKAELAEQRMYAESYVKEVLLLRSENASLQAKLAGGQPDPVKFGCYDAEMAAEIARLRAELDDTLRLWNEGVEAQRRQYDFDLNELRAELAKYTGDLTDEQADAVGVLRDPCGVSMTHYYKFIDAAIRKVRSGEGEG